MASVYTVAEINSYIKNMFAQDYLLHQVSVKGEVSNCTYHAKGHIYFTLKDKLSVIPCVMWASNRKGLSFSLSEGMQIVVTGQIGAYEPQGKYQLYATSIKEDGLGELYIRYEALKRELEERGMFAPEYKQPIPKICKTLGVVTAPTGAAVRDIISISKSRNPYIQIVLYPALVQGADAAASIVRGIKALEAYGVDTMIVGRGGGSIEDLWAFNEEVVAQAIFDCSVPVISAVGHETDTTIADYVADARAQTPSAAAQMAVMDVVGFMDNLDAYRQLLGSRMSKKLQSVRLQIANRMSELGRLSPASRIKEREFSVARSEERLRNGMQAAIERKSMTLALLQARLQGVSPLEKLSQGYSYTVDERGECIKDVSRLSAGDHITVTVYNGKINAVVESTDSTAEWLEDRND